MADRKYNSWHIEKMEKQILKVRLLNLIEEKELCFALMEKAKLENDWYALAFSYTFLSDYYLASKNNDGIVHYLEKAMLLCRAKNFTDLLVKIYNFYGMFYNSICDEITALDYYLKSMSLAEERKDYIQMASTYNNIATLFDIKHNYEEAILYYEKSYQVLQNADSDTIFSKAVILSNLCRCYFKLNKIDFMKNTLEIFYNIIQQEKEKLLNFLYLYCLLLKQILAEEMSIYVNTMDEILQIEKTIENKRVVHQVLTSICEELLDINEYQYTKLFLNILSNINQDNDFTAKKELQNLIVRYYQAIESEAKQLKEYREFYKIINEIEIENKKTASSGLSAKIDLYQAKVKQNNLEKENEKLEKLMNIDELTGICNRRCFNRDIISNHVQKCQNIAIAMLDIDYFKEYNDIYGHLKGDLILHEVGSILKEINSSISRVYRYGGDEFVIIFLEQSEEAVKETIDIISQKIKDKNIEHKGCKTGTYLTITCGYAMRIDQNMNLETLLNKADNHLYEIKNKR